MKEKKKINEELLRNRTVVGIVIVIVALIIGFGIIPLYNSQITGTVTVVRTKQDIQQGQQITGNMLETVKVTKLNIPHGVETVSKNVIGKYAATKIVKSDMVFASMLTTHNSYYDLRAGQMLFSVTVKNLADGLSGKLQPGDIVSAFVQKSQSTGNSVIAATVPKELQSLRVAAVTSSTGEDTNKATSAQNNGENLPATVTLVANQQQAAVLAGYESGTIHLALVSRNNEKQALQLLAEQDVVFQSSSSSSSSQGGTK